MAPESMIQKWDWTIPEAFSVTPEWTTVDNLNFEFDNSPGMPSTS